MRREPMSSTESRNSLPWSVTISVPSPYHLRSSWSAGKSRPIRSAARHRPRPWRVVCLRRFFPPGDELLVAHDLRDGVLADPLPGLMQVGGDPRGAVPTVMLGEQPGDLGGQRHPAGVLRRGVAVPPLVEPRLADAQRPTGGRVRHLMLLPLGGDKGGHRYRPIASSTQRATERLSTSRCIRSSVTSLRNRTSSARSSSLN